MIFASK